MKTLMNTLNKEAEQVFSYLPIGFIQAKKTNKGFALTHTVGKPDEIKEFNLKMECAGALNKNGAWWFPATSNQSLSYAVNAAGKEAQEKQDSDRKARGLPTEAELTGK